MDNFREWLSDNLRYILLGLAIILILTIAILAVRFIGAGIGGDTNGGNSGSGTGTEAVTPAGTEGQSETAGSGTEGGSENAADAQTEGGTEAGSAAGGETESGSSSGTEEALVENDPTVLAFVQEYYTAIQNRDVDAYSALVDEVTDEARATLEGDSVVESYSNIRVYTKSGLTEGSYVAYMCYDTKVTGVDELAPGMSACYISTRDDGSLYMVNPDSDPQIASYMQEVQDDADVQALITEVQNNYNEVLNSNDTLRSLMDTIATPDTEVVLPDADSTGVQSNQVVQATAVVNVRADSTTDAEIIGMLDEGATITRIRELDNGWSEVRYGDAIGYISSEYLTVYTDSTESTSASTEMGTESTTEAVQ